MTHITQLDNEFTNDCGPATIVQGVYLLTGLLLTIRAVVTWIGNANKFTTVAQMIAAFKHYGVSARYEGNATWDVIRRALDDGLLVFALVAYEQFSDNPLGYIYAHWITALNYDATHVMVHDPLRRTGPTRVTIPEFVRAINTPSKYVGGFNRPNQAIIAEAARQMPVPSVLARVRRGAVSMLRETGYGEVA
jgi:hypothetical protein